MPIIILMYLLLIPGVAGYLHIKGKAPRLRAVTLKGACTAVIVLAALAGVTQRGAGVPLFHGLIIVGLAFGLAGDVIIGASFLAGMAVFALGHICYIAALLIVSQNTIIAVPIWLVLYAALFIYYKKSGIDPGKLLWPSAAYAAIIAVMCSLSFTVTGSAPVLLPAAILFTISDFLLAFLTFTEQNKRLDGISLWCYYAGQSLFAVSVILAT